MRGGSDRACEDLVCFFVTALYDPSFFKRLLLPYENAKVYVTQTLHRYFYHSKLSEQYGASCVSSIIKTARVFNAVNGITGVLVFDGERFCQYVEGPQSSVQSLIERIQIDPRHTLFMPLLDAPLVGPRVYDGWSMAYCLLEGTPFIRTLLEKSPQEALEFLHASRNTLDMA